MTTGMVDFERDFALRQALKEGDAQAVRQAVEALLNLVNEQGYFDRLAVFDLGQAVQNLDAFAEAVVALTTTTHQIAAAAEEQSRMAEEIAVAIDQIAALAQDHAQAAELGFGQGERLSDLSRALREQVADFRLN